MHVGYSYEILLVDEGRAISVAPEDRIRLLEADSAFQALQVGGLLSRREDRDALTVPLVGDIVRRDEGFGLWAMTTPTQYPVAAAVNRQGMERHLDAVQDMFRVSGSPLGDLQIVSPAIPGTGLLCRAYETYELHEGMVAALFDASMAPTEVWQKCLLPFFVIRRLLATTWSLPPHSKDWIGCARWHALSRTQALFSLHPDIYGLFSLQENPEGRWTLRVGAAQPGPLARLDTMTLSLTAMVLSAAAAGKCSSQFKPLLDVEAAFNNCASGDSEATIELESGLIVSWKYGVDAYLRMAIDVLDSADRSDESLPWIVRGLVAAHRWLLPGESPTG